MKIKVVTNPEFITAIKILYEHDCPLVVRYSPDYYEPGKDLLVFTLNDDEFEYWFQSDYISVEAANAGVYYAPMARTLKKDVNYIVAHN